MEQKPYRMAPACVFSPYIKEPGIDIFIDLWGHGYLFSVGGTLEPVVSDGDLIDMCIDRNDFFLLETHRINA